MQPQILLAVEDEERRLVYEAFIRKEQAICISLRDVANQAPTIPITPSFWTCRRHWRVPRYEKSLVEDALHAIPNASPCDIVARTRKIRMCSWDIQAGTRSAEEHLIAANRRELLHPQQDPA